MNGHYYVTMRHADGRSVQFAFPAELLDESRAIDVARAFAPGWVDVDVTWRAAFDQHCLPANSQGDYQRDLTVVTEHCVSYISDADRWPNGTGTTTASKRLSRP